MTPAYEVQIYWSPADQAYIAAVPELPGCMADGPTRKEALVAAEGVIAEWLATAREEGRAVPKPRARLGGARSAR